MGERTNKTIKRFEYVMHMYVHEEKHQETTLQSEVTVGEECYRTPANKTKNLSETFGISCHMHRKNRDGQKWVASTTFILLHFLLLFYSASSLSSYSSSLILFRTSLSAAYSYTKPFNVRDISLH